MNLLGEASQREERLSLGGWLDGATATRELLFASDFETHDTNGFGDRNALPGLDFLGL